MTFLQLQNEMLPTGVGNTARFKETQRASAKLWINARYAEVWGLEDWTFRKAFAAVTATAGSDTLAMPSDFGIVIGAKGLVRDDGDYLIYLTPDAFQEVHVGTTDTGTPGWYTVVNRQVKVHPTPSATSAAWQVHHNKRLVELANDADVPAIPAEHHHMLVHGSEASGQIRMQDFTYQFSEQIWQNSLDAMRRNYLVDVRGAAKQFGSVY